MNRNLIMSVFVLGCLFLHGQDPDLPMDELGLYEDLPVVISAAMKPQLQSEAPSTVEVFTNQDLRDLGITKLEDALRTIAGIDLFFVQARRNTVNVRGLGNLGEGVLIMRDGVVLNRPNSGNVELDHFINLSNVQQIEIIRGPGSSLYGANAFAGVVNIISKPFSKESEAGVTISGGSYGSRQVGVELNQNRVQLGLFHTMSDGFRGNAVNDQDILESYSGTVRGKITPALTAHGSFSKHRIGIAGTVQPTLGNRDNIENYHLGLGYSRRLNSNLMMKVDTNYLENQRVQGSTGLSNTTQDSRLNAGLRLNWKLGGNDLLVGLAYRRETAEATELVGGNRSTFTNTIFGQWDRRFKDRFLLTLGARLDDHSVFGNHFSPRGSIIFQPSNGIWLKGSYGHAFRAPTFQNLFIDREVFPRVIARGDMDLEPETVDTFELGMIIQTAAGLKMELNAFRSDGRDIVTTRNRLLIMPPDPPINIFQFVNADEITSQGIEFSFRYAAGRRLKIRGNATYQDPRERNTDLRILKAPQKTANLIATLSLDPANRMHLSLHGRFVGNRIVEVGRDPNLSRAFLGEYTALDAFLQADLKWGWELTARIVNAFDKEYEEEVAQPGVPRFVMLGVRYSY